jgi:hypothetical protein
MAHYETGVLSMQTLKVFWFTLSSQDDLVVRDDKQEMKPLGSFIIR